MAKFKRQGKLVRLYEVWFNGNRNNFDRVSASTKKEAEAKMKSFYPNDKVSGSKLV